MEQERLIDIQEVLKTLDEGVLMQDSENNAMYKNGAFEFIAEKIKESTALNNDGNYLDA